MSDGDAMWAGHMVSFAITAQTLSLGQQLRQQDRRVEENNAVWQWHYDALADRFNRLAADHNILLSWANTAAAERDAALARVAALEKQLADERDKHAWSLESARNRADQLDRHVQYFLRMRQET